MPDFTDFMRSSSIWLCIGCFGLAVVLTIIDVLSKLRRWKNDSVREIDEEV